jgi:hypothetical protein
MGDAKSSANKYQQASQLEEIGNLTKDMMFDDKHTVKHKKNNVESKKNFFLSELAPNTQMARAV